MIRHLFFAITLIGTGMLLNAQAEASDILAMRGSSRKLRRQMCQPHRWGR